MVFSPVTVGNDIGLLERIEAGFGARLVCPADVFNGHWTVGSTTGYVRPSTLIVLFTAPECTPHDLFEVDTTPVEHLAAPPRPAGWCSRTFEAAGPNGISG